MRHVSRAKDKENAASRFGKPRRMGEAYSSDQAYSQPKEIVVFGVEPVRELVAAAPSEIVDLYVRNGLETRFGKLVEAVRACGGKVHVADENTLNRLSGAEARHQGLVAICRAFNYITLDELVESKFDPVLVIEEITDPRNLGAIMRSAEGAGVSAIALARDRTVEVTPVAIKASAGAWAHLKIAPVGNLVRTLEKLKEAGYWIVGLAPEGSCTIYEIDVNRRLAVVVGGEQKGLRPIVERACDYLAAVPMYGKIASLNVAVATGIALYEFARRRAIRPTPSQGERP